MNSLAIVRYNRKLFLYFSDLFYTALDMLSCLVHGTLVSDSSSERGDENKKSYLNLVKKLKVRCFFRIFSATVNYGYKDIDMSNSQI